MPSTNRIILASAGSGKTTTIVSEAAREPGVRSALVTYTNNSEAELRIKANGICGCVPPHLRTATWFGFLLQHLIRPYQRAAYAGRVRGLALVNGMSARWTKEADTQRHYFGRPGDIYVDKVSKFACKLIRETGGKPVERLAQIVDRIYVDEAQDLAGYDLDLIERLLDSDIDVVLVGDHRQATFKTNQSAKNRRFGKQGIIDKFEAWQAGGRARIEIHNHSYRCVQEICDAADKLFPDVAGTISRNHTRTSHDGMFSRAPTGCRRLCAKILSSDIALQSPKEERPGNSIQFRRSEGDDVRARIDFSAQTVGDVLLDRQARGRREGTAENLRGDDPGAAECRHRRAERDGRGYCSGIPGLVSGPTRPWAMRVMADNSSRFPRVG